MAMFTPGRITVHACGERIAHTHQNNGRSTRRMMKIYAWVLI